VTCNFPFSLWYKLLLAHTHTHTCTQCSNSLHNLQIRDISSSWTFTLVKVASLCFVDNNCGNYLHQWSWKEVMFLSVLLSLSVCYQDNSKSTHRIFITVCMWEESCKAWKQWIFVTLRSKVKVTKIQDELYKWRSQELIHGSEPNFIRKHNITKPKLGKIFDLEVKGQGH